MNFNATLIGQTITFIVFVWFCMKFVWPPIMHALQERKKKIADGLAASERGKHEQELAEERAKKILLEAKEKAGELGLGCAGSFLMGVGAGLQARSNELILMLKS